MEQHISSILCCVGLRGDSHGVLEQSTKLALATGARLHVLHVVKPLAEDVMNTLKVNIRNRESLEGFLRQRIDQARERLETKIEEFLERHPDQRQALSAQVEALEVLEGYPASVISEVAAKRGHDFIVIAANKHGLTASYAGKVAKGVLKRSLVPVMVVPGPA
ncbi:Nucleotide-binding universal stress protein, UspA family [Modicisalibacter ilicicola DSM 19980]|uniref:Nucleotide-binding universal stress protein, UspA family n=1 Tax=Modicisalibacter ilicicola DSM 19980 TaxID=1121942 RepID=A0A1M4TG86_9GAMM|nr:universal stress protein [Halomonas ilicicola]SHE43451.1 Nucleotide-binding universal stress protein, UspA family [Halomonas ilicicola DSM 19980]